MAIKPNYILSNPWVSVGVWINEQHSAGSINEPVQTHGSKLPTSHNLECWSFPFSSQPLHKPRSNVGIPLGQLDLIAGPTHNSRLDHYGSLLLLKTSFSGRNSDGYKCRFTRRKFLLWNKAKFYFSFRSSDFSVDLATLPFVLSVTFLQWFVWLHNKATANRVSGYTGDIRAVSTVGRCEIEHWSDQLWISKEFFSLLSRSGL